MSRSAHDLAQALADAGSMDYGPPYTAVIEAIVAEADAGGHAKVSLDARLQLTGAYQHGAEPQKSFATFGWCQAARRDRPELFDTRSEHLLRWHYKYVVSTTIRFPQITLPQVHAVLEDMERSYREGGNGLAPVHQHRHLLARHVGDRETAEREFGSWVTLPRTPLSDCAACDPEAQAEWHLLQGRDEQALALADEVLSGQYTCLEQPQSIRSTLLLAYLRLGRFEDARHAHLSSYRAARTNPGSLSVVARHVEFCALTGNEARGLEILERHVGWLDAPRDTASEMRFVSSAALLMRRFVELGRGDAEVRADSTGTVTSVAGAEVVWRERALALAARFDARNGTTTQGDLVRARLAADPLVDHLPLTAASRPPRPPADAPVPPPAVDVDRPAADLVEEFERSWATDRTTATGLARAVVAATADAEDPALLAQGASAAGILAWQDEDLATAGQHFVRAESLFADDPMRQRLTFVRRTTVALLAARDGADPSPYGADPSPSAADPSAADAADEAARALPGLGAPTWAVVEAHRWAGVSLAVTGRLDEAVALVDGALPHADHPLLAADLHMTAAGAHASAGRHEQALAEAEQVWELRADHPARRSGVAEMLASLYRGAGRPADALLVLDLALPHADPARVAVLRHERGLALMALDRHGEAVDDLADALVRCTDPVAAAEVGYALGWVLRRLGRNLEAAEVLEGALPGYVRHGDPVATARTRSLLAGALADLRETDDALRHLDLALAELRHGTEQDAEHGTEQEADPELTRFVAELSGQAGRVAERGGAWDRAAAHFGTLVELALRLGDPLGATFARNDQARTTSMLDPDASSVLFATTTAELDALPEDDDVRWARAELLWQQAWTLWNLDRNEEAEPFAQRAEQAFLAASDQRAAARSALLSGRLRAERGRDAEARPHVERALSVFTAIDEPGLADEAGELLASLDEFRDESQ